MRIKIGIWGSCLTRDIFRSVFNDYKEHFEIISSLERVSLVSLMGDSIEFNDEDIRIYPLDDNKNIFDSEILKKDLSKDYLKIIGENIDYLIIDEFFEAYFGLIEINNTYITNNFWHYPKTKFYETISENKKLSLNDNFIEYFELWKNNCDKFFEYFYKNFPDVKIILNKVKLSSKVLKKDGSYNIDENFQKDVEKYNPLIEVLESYLEQKYDLLVIDCTNDIYVNENHIWGKSPFHLQDSFYIRAFEKILEVIGDNQVNNEQLDDGTSSQAIDSEFEISQDNHNYSNNSSDNPKLNEYLEIKKYLFEEASVNTNFIDVSRLKDYFNYISRNNFKNADLALQEASFNELIKINKFVVENKESLGEETKTIENEINSPYFDENAPFLRKYFESRIDIKNYGNETNEIIILNDDNQSLNITRPAWFNNDEGIGTLIGSTKGDLNLSFKCVNEGKLVIAFKSVDFKDKNGSRIPIYIDYTEIMVNDDVIIDESQVAWHDSPIIFEKEVKDGEIINIKVKWNPLSYKTNIFLNTDHEKLINNFYDARLDFKNAGDENNDLILLSCDDSSSHIYKPKWFKGKNGIGTVVSSGKRKINVSFKCVNDGNFEINFRAMDLRYENHRLPIFIEYTKIQINDRDILGGNFITWHDNPFKYGQEVKNNEIINIHVEWKPLSHESYLPLLHDNDYSHIYSQARIDIKNYGDETNDISFDENGMFYNISECNDDIDSKGAGYTINSFNEELNISFKCINEGNLKIDFKAIDFRDKNNNRIPIYIDYKEIEIDGESIINGSTALCYDNSLCYDKRVNDGQIVNIKLKWQPLSKDSNCNNILVNSINNDEEIKRLKRELQELNNENKELINLKNELLSSLPLKNRFLYKIRGIKL